MFENPVSIRTKN